MKPSKDDCITCLQLVYRQSSVKKTTSKNISSNNTPHIFTLFTVYTDNGTRTVYICILECCKGHLMLTIFFCKSNLTKFTLSRMTWNGHSNFAAYFTLL